jgi:hypothetical protein
MECCDFLRVGGPDGGSWRTGSLDGVGGLVVWMGWEVDGLVFAL